MYLILIAWFYVTLMMAIAEATNPVGSVLGGIITFVLYGLLPMGIVGYIMGTPERKRRLHARREAEQQAWDAAQAQPAPDAANTANAAADLVEAPATIAAITTADTTANTTIDTPASATQHAAAPAATEPRR